MALYVVFIIIGYMVASIPFALIIGKVFKNKDVRQYGSGNVGSTNAARVLGYKLGALTLVCDILKGAIPTMIALFYSRDLAVVTAIACVLGHSYSIFLKFKGGKAVATTVGTILVLAPLSLLGLLVIFIGVVFISGYVSVASMTCGILLPFFIYITGGAEHVILYGWLVGLFVVYRHNSNIRNLYEKKEEKFFDKAKKL